MSYNTGINQLVKTQEFFNNTTAEDQPITQTNLSLIANLRYVQNWVVSAITGYLPTNNPNFIGKTLFDTLINMNDYFKNNYSIKWLFDGDTIEFNTLFFFNSKLCDCIEELYNYRDEFITHLNTCFDTLHIFTEFGAIDIMQANYPFANYLTNFNNYSMFNNGSLHYNITLPTRLDENGNIADFLLFTHIHSLAIKIIQWMEPFIVAIYGNPDIFSKMDEYKNSNKFSNSSQRCAISRYIGLGTYDSDKLESFFDSFQKLRTNQLMPPYCVKQNY